MTSICTRQTLAGFCRTCKWSNIYFLRQFFNFTTLCKVEHKARLISGSVHFHRYNFSTQQNSLSAKTFSIVSDESFMEENQKPAEVAHKSGLYCSKIDEEENTKELLLLTYEWPKLIG